MSLLCSYVCLTDNIVLCESLKCQNTCISFLPTHPKKSCRPVPRGGSVGSDEPPSLQRGPLLNTTHLSLVVPQ